MRLSSVPTLFGGFVLSALTLLLGACATPQAVVEQNVDAAVSEALPDIPESWRAAATSGEPVAGWIESFADPVLVDLVVEAQANNQNLAAAAARVDQARSLARQAGASLSPQGSVGAGSSRSGQLDRDGQPISDSVNVGLQVSWELDVWGRIRSGVAQAAASAQAAEADFLFAQYSLAASVASAYFAAIEANYQLKVAQDTLALLERTRQIVQAQYDEGVASAQDLALTESDTAAARERQLALEGTQRSALRAIELLLGRYPGAELAVRTEYPEVPPGPGAGLQSELLERRADLVAAERRVAAAFNATEQAKAARLPSLALTGSLGGGSDSLADVLNPANVAWSAGSSLLAPIFDGGRLRENVKIATSEQEAALADYAAAALRAFGEVESALDQGTLLAGRDSELQRAVDEAQKAYRLSDITYKEGEISLLDLLVIQQRLFAARSNQAAIRRLLLQQRVDLNLALGGPWQS